MCVHMCAWARLMLALPATMSLNSRGLAYHTLHAAVTLITDTIALNNIAVINEPHEHQPRLGLRVHACLLVPCRPDNVGSLHQNRSKGCMSSTAGAASAGAESHTQYGSSHTPPAASQSCFVTRICTAVQLTAAQHAPATSSVPHDTSCW